MRAACNIYEHPELSGSEIWAKDARGSSGKTRVFIALGALALVATISTLAVCHVLGVYRLDFGSLNSSMLRGNL